MTTCHNSRAIVKDIILCLDIKQKRLPVQRLFQNNMGFFRNFIRTVIRGAGCAFTAVGSFGRNNFNECYNPNPNPATQAPNAFICSMDHRRVSVVTSGSTSKATFQLSCLGGKDINLLEGDCTYNTDSDLICDPYTEVSACCNEAGTTMLVFGQQISQGSWSLDISATPDVSSREVSGNCEIVTNGSGDGSLPVSCDLEWTEAGSVKYGFS